MSLYSIMLGSSLIIGAVFIYNNLVKHGMKKEMVFYQLLLTMLCITTFSKLVTIISSWESDINMFNAGFSSLGGAIGVIVSVLIHTKIYNDNTKLLYETFALSLPLMYGVAKMGCHFAGCCHGIPYDGIFSTTSNYCKEQIELFPVQLAETIVFLLIFIVSIILYYKKIDINYLAFEMIICAVSKFMLDYLRYSNLGKVITFNQIMCIIFCIIGIIILARNIHKKRGQRYGKKQV